MRKILAGSLCAIIAAIAPAAAQSLPPDPGTWAVSLGAGATVPVGNTADHLKTGIHGAAAIGYQLPDSHLMFGVEGMYLRASNKTIPGDHSNIVVATAHAHIGLGGPYIVLGAGLLRDEYKQPLGSVVITNTHATFSLEGRLGIEFAKVLFLEGRVIHSFRTDDHVKYTLIPITLGIKF
mgnify:CR=1 FL=1